MKKSLALLIASFSVSSNLMCSEQAVIVMLKPEEITGYDKKGEAAAQKIIQAVKQRVAPEQLLSEMGKAFVAASPLKAILDTTVTTSSFHQKALCELVAFYRALNTCLNEEHLKSTLHPQEASLTDKENGLLSTYITTFEALYLQPKNYEDMKKRNALLSIQTRDWGKLNVQQFAQELDKWAKGQSDQIEPNWTALRQELSVAMEQLKKQPAIHVPLYGPLWEQGIEYGKKLTIKLTLLAQGQYGTLELPNTVQEALFKLLSRPWDCLLFGEIKGFFRGQLDALNQFDLSKVLAEHKTDESIAHKIRDTYNEELQRAEIFSYAGSFESAVPLLTAFSTCHGHGN